MNLRIDTRDTKPKLRALLLLTVAAAVCVGALALADAERFKLVICIVMAIYALGVILMLLRALREQIRYNPYSYNTIFYTGFTLFALSVLITFVVLSARIIRYHGGIPAQEILRMMLDSAKNYVVISVPFLLLFAAALTVSNVELIRKEGGGQRNLLGFFLALAILMGVEILFLLDRRASVLHGSQRLPWKLLANLFAAVGLYFECMLFGVIFAGALSARYEPEKDKDFLIVLGCGLRKDGTPTPLLAGRLDRALTFYETQKKETGEELTFVVSGGQGADEVRPESAAMKQYLMEKGVPEERIIEENQSTNTFENMKFSKEKILKIDPEAKIAFATDVQHVFRSGLFARRVKMRAIGMGAKTKWYFWPNAAVREFAGLLVKHRGKQALILGCLVAFYVVLTLLIR